MTVEQFFQAAFVINLTRRHDRLEQFRADMPDAGIGSDFIQIWEAFDNPENGHAGCTRSHRELLRHIAAGPWERVLVFEDDCAPITETALREHGFTPDSVVWKRFASIDGMNVNQKFSGMTKFIPDDWDALYLGAGYGEPPIKRINKRIIRCGFMQTTSSYGITRDCAREWTDRVNNRCRLEEHPGPIDNLFGSMSRDFNYYVLQPRLFYQRASKSDITGQTTSYFNSMTDPVAENSV